MKKLKHNVFLDCKACDHEVDLHAVGKFAKVVSYFLSGQYGKCMAGPWCQCRQYLPKDNLRYLEWRYDNDTSTQR